MFLFFHTYVNTHMHACTHAGEREKKTKQNKKHERRNEISHKARTSNGDTVLSPNLHNALYLRSFLFRWNVTDARCWPRPDDWRAEGLRLRSDARAAGECTPEASCRHVENKGWQDRSPQGHRRPHPGVDCTQV